MALTDFMKRNGIINFQQDDLFYYDSKKNQIKTDSKGIIQSFEANKPSIEEEELMFGVVEGTIHDKRIRKAK